MTDKQKRRPPAYQVYAADDLANSSYFMLSAGERGLLDSMHRACWVEDAVPADPSCLARVVRLPEAEVKQYLTPAVVAHFAPVASDTARLQSPELVRQQTNFSAARDKQSEGGKLGAALTNGARFGKANSLRPNDPPEGTGRPASRPATPELRREESRREERKASLNEADNPEDNKHADWLREHAEAESALERGR